MLGHSLQGQISISIDIEKDTVGIGDLNNMVMKVITPKASWVSGYSLEPFNQIKPDVSYYAEDSLDLLTNAEFDFLDLNTDQPVILSPTNFEKQADGKYVHTNITRFVTWDIGEFVIPDVELSLDTTGGKRLNVRPLKPNRLVVKPPTDLVIPDSTQVIAPILPIIKEEKNWQDWMWLIYIQIYLLLIGLFMYFILRKRKKKMMLEAAPIIVRPSHEVAFERLDDLEAKQLWQQGKVKEYQSELTYTIREYLENRFDIQALESTTAEINKSLKTVDFDPKHTTDLNNILQIADMVKFSKATPEESIHQEFMDKARSLVKDTLFIKPEETDELAD